MRSRLKHLTGNLHAKLRKRHDRAERESMSIGDEYHSLSEAYRNSQETPLTLRSKLAWITIALMVCVIITAALKEHPGYVRKEYEIVKTESNPYMGWATPDGNAYLLLVHASWADIQPDPPDESLFPDMSLGYVWHDAAYILDTKLKPNQHIVLQLDSLDDSDIPEWVRELSKLEMDAEVRDTLVAELWEKAVRNLAQYLSGSDDVAYIQLDRTPGSDVPVKYGELQLLSPLSNGTWGCHLCDEDGWLESAAAGTIDDIFGNHLTYLLGVPDDTELAGQVGYAIGVSQAEWHTQKNRNDRLFVNFDIYNAGVAPLYYDYRLQLSLHWGESIWATEIQNVDLRKLITKSLRVEGYIDVPYNIAKGPYTLCVAIVDPDTGLPAIHMTMNDADDDLYYELGTVVIK